MAKVRLGQRPKNFKRTVEFQLLDGSKASIEITYIYRTRKELGEHVDAWQKARQQEAEAEMAARIKAHEEAAAAATAAGEEPPQLQILSQAEMQAKSVDGTADYLMTIVEGWNLDDTELNLQNMQQLCDEVPAAAAAISEGYRAAINEGRLGN